ncbi:hypothetical protein Tco_0794942 [Tanacetum coccineum]
MNDHLKAQQVLNDFMSKLREMFQTWLQQRQEQVVNLDTYTPEPSQCQNIPICYDDDDDEYSFAIQEYLKKFSSAITPDLPKSNSLIIEDKHLDTIPETESDEVIKSSVEDLVHTLNDIISIPSGSGNDQFCAESSLTKSVLNRDKKISSPKIDFLLEEFASELALIAPIPPGIVKADFDPKGDIYDSETVIDSNNDYSSIDNDSLYSDDIDYVEASPPDSELVSLKVVDIVIPKVRGIDTDILLTIKDDILQSETFYFNLEDISSGSPTSYLDLSLLNYEAFFCNSEPNSGNFTMVVVEDIFDNPTREPRVHVPNILPTHPNLQLDSDFTLSSDSLGSDLVVSFPSGTRNNIFDPGIFIEVQSKRFLSPNDFSISFIRDPLSLVCDTLLPFSSKNEDNLISESPVMISGGDIPILDVLFSQVLHILVQLKNGDTSQAQDSVNKNKRFDCPNFEASRAYGCPSFTRASNPSFYNGIQYPTLN